MKKRYLTARHFYTEMSSGNKEILNVILVLGIVFIPFFIYQISKKNNYNFYEGTITKIDVGRVYSSYRGQKRYDVIYQPTVRYIRNNDTLIFTEGRQNLFAYFYKPEDRVSVAEEKEQPWNNRIYTFWYFVKGYEIVYLLLCWGFIYVVCFMIPKYLKKN